MDAHDLPEPAALWTRWGALAAALTAVGFDDVWTAGESGAHHDDHGGNWAHLALVEGGRAVLYGYDHEYSDTVSADPPIDLLAGAPDWLPWAELAEVAARDELGYVYWHDGGRWARVGYPDRVNDGLTSTAGAVLDDGAAVAELSDFVFEWGEHEPDDAATRAHVRTAAELIVSAAGRDELDAGVLAACPSRDPAAGLAVAAAAGLTPGRTRPRIPAGTRPATRRIRALSDTEHDRLVWDAMQSAAELDRPAPPPTPALDDLVAWVRAHGGSLRFYADNNSSSAQGEAGRDLRTFSEAQELVERVREEEGHPEYGRWLFLRVGTTATDATVERRYDSWPSWWDDDRHSGPWQSTVRREIRRRAEQWRPSWTPLLDESVAYREV